MLGTVSEQEILNGLIYDFRVFKNSHSKSSLLVISVILTLISSSVGVSLASTQPREIKGCVDKKTGSVRIAKKCKPVERSIRWGTLGPQGPRGDRGEVGEKGSQGPRGSTILSGSGGPNSNIGTDGDFYIDYTSVNLYGPKRDGSWGTPRELIGPRGPVGSQGPGGPQGPTGPIGATGPTGATGASATRLYLWNEDGVKQTNTEFVGAWGNDYYFKIADKLWRLNNLGTVKSYQVYFRDTNCTQPAVFISGGSGWDETDGDPLINSHFKNSYYFDNGVYRVTGPIVNLGEIFSYDGTTCASMTGGTYEMIKAEVVSGEVIPSSFGRLTIGP